MSTSDVLWTVSTTPRLIQQPRRVSAVISPAAAGHPLNLRRTSDTSPRVSPRRTRTATYGRRVVTVHAFVDESARGQTYIVCAAIVDPGNLRPVRQQLRGLLLPGQRELHFKFEKVGRQRMIADRIAALPVSVQVYVARCARKQQEAARQRCLELLVRDLLVRRAQYLVLDSRGHRDTVDQLTLYRALGSKPASTDLTYDHQDSVAECLIWIADTVAWCYGAGGDWRRRVEPVITAVTQVDL